MGAVVSLWAPVILVGLAMTWLKYSNSWLVNKSFDCSQPSTMYDGWIFCRCISWTLRYGIQFSLPYMVVLVGHSVVLER